MPSRLNNNKSSETKEEVGNEIIRERSERAQKEIMEINDLELISEFLHERKREMLEILIFQEKTIQELSDEMDLNPGSIKRHLDSLVKKDLVFQTKITQNQWGIRLKYYQACAKKYIIHFQFPDEK